MPFDNLQASPEHKIKHTSNVHALGKGGCSKVRLVDELKSLGAKGLKTCTSRELMNATASSFTASIIIWQNYSQAE